MTIDTALITHRAETPTACISLAQILARIPELRTQHWVQERQYPVEEQIPHHGLLNPLLLRLLGIRDAEQFSIPLARQGGLDASLAASDVIHLHHFKGDTLSLSSLATCQQPIICDLQDDYPLTALCSHSKNCQQYLYSCRNCPQCSPPSIVERIFAYKKRCFDAMRQLVFIAPSHKRQHEARRSPMLRGKEVRHIGLAVDCQQLKAHRRIDCKSERDIPPHERVIAFQCSKDLADWEAYEKNIIQSICQQLHEEGYLALHILILGKNGCPPLPYPSSCAIPKQDAQERARLYSSCDMIIHLSHLDEDEPYALEAMACQVPIITHRRGNMSEYVEHQQRGFSMAGKLDQHLSDVVERIKQLLHAPILRAHLGLNARRYIEQEHELNFITALYRQLYQEMLSSVNPCAPATVGRGDAWVHQKHPTFLAHPAN